MLRLFLKNFFLFLFLICLTSRSDAILNDKPGAILSFTVVQNEFIFDYKNIQSATIIEKDYEYKGLHLKLKPEAIESFKRITASGVGKVALLVIDNRIVSSSTIQSSLGGDMLITGISRGDAQDIINKLKALQTQKESKFIIE